MLATLPGRRLTKMALTARGSFATRSEASDSNGIARAWRLSFEITPLVEGPFGPPASSAREMSCVDWWRASAEVTVGRVPVPLAVVADAAMIAVLHAAKS